MTPTQQLGYNDQKAGAICPDLSRADTAKGREYRDGLRMARRDEVDAIDGALNAMGAALDPVERAVLLAEQVHPEAPARVVQTVDGFVAMTDVREGQMVSLDDLSTTKRAEPTDHEDEASPFSGVIEIDLPDPLAEANAELRALDAEAAAKTAYQVAHENGGHGAFEGSPILDMKLAEMRAKNQPTRPVDAVEIIPPVYEKKRARKAKPVDEGQGSFL